MPRDVPALQRGDAFGVRQHSPLQQPQKASRGHAVGRQSVLLHTVVTIELLSDSTFGFEELTEVFRVTLRAEFLTGMNNSYR